MSGKCTIRCGLLLALAAWMSPAAGAQQQPPAPVIRPLDLAALQPPAPPAVQPEGVPGLDEEGDSVLPSADETAPPRPTPPRPPAPPRRRTTLLAGAPNMFGDFYSGSLGKITFGPQPMVIEQVWDSRAPVPFFVANAQGPGANMDPAVPIQVLPVAGGSVIAFSVAPGQDLSGDGQPDTYEISEPNGSSPGAGFVYLGGQAVFGAPTTGPQDGSVGNPDNWFLRFQHQMAQQHMMVSVPQGGAAVRRVKLAENNSPQPRNRLFFNYNFFNDVIGQNRDVNRYVFGVERTVLDGLTSLELRAPFAATIGDRQVVGAPQRRGTEFGNLTLALKTVLLQERQYLIAGGVGMTFPTSDATRVVLPNGMNVVRWESESFHVLPYVAALLTPSRRCFWQTFLQFDIDTNGSTVWGNSTGGPLQRLGKIQDTPLMFVDVGGGWRIYDNPLAGCIRQAHAIAELHYATTLRDADFATGNGLTVNSLTNRFDVLNLTLGVNFRSTRSFSIRPAMVLPLRNGDDQQFDYEAMVQANILR